MDQKTQLHEWLGRVSRAQKYNFRRSFFCRWWYLMIGLIVICGSICSAVLAFGLPNPPLANAGLLVGVVSIIVTVLASAQTFLNLRALFDAHLKAAKEYNKLKIELENEIVSSNDKSSFMKEFIDRWSSVIDESPGIPPKLYKEGAH